MSELAHYFDRIADEFNGYYTGRRPSLVQEIGYRVFRGPGLRRRFADTVRIVGECKDRKILDVGCGPCTYTQYFVEKKAEVTAIDVSRNMIELARKNLTKTGFGNARLILGDFLQHDFTEVFDYTLAIGFFDYIGIPERDAYFDKLKKITAKKIVATFPKRFTPQAPIRKLLFLIKKQPVFFYTKGMIKDLAQRHNLKVIFHNSGPIWTGEFIEI